MRRLDATAAVLLLVTAACTDPASSVIPVENRISPAVMKAAAERCATEKTATETLPAEQKSKLCICMFQHMAEVISAREFLDIAATIQPMPQQQKNLTLMADKRIMNIASVCASEIARTG